MLTVELSAAELARLAAILDYARPERPGADLAAWLKNPIEAGRRRAVEILEDAGAESWLEMERRTR